MTNRFRNTALYHALQATLHSPPEYTATEGFILDPAEAVITPTLAQVQSRWSGTPDDEVEGILRDYEWEAETLKGLGLEDVVDRVKELAIADWE